MVVIITPLSSRQIVKTSEWKLSSSVKCVEIWSCLSLPWCTYYTWYSIQSLGWVSSCWIFWERKHHQNQVWWTFLAHCPVPSGLRAPEGKTTSYSSLSTQHLAENLAISWCSVNVYEMSEAFFQAIEMLFSPNIQKDSRHVFVKGVIIIHF